MADNPAQQPAAPKTPRQRLMFALMIMAPVLVVFGLFFLGHQLLLEEAPSSDELMQAYASKTLATKPDPLASGMAAAGITIGTTGAAGAAGTAGMAGMAGMAAADNASTTDQDNTTQPQIAEDGTVLLPQYTYYSFPEAFSTNLAGNSHIVTAEISVVHFGSLMDSEKFTIDMQNMTPALRNVVLNRMASADAEQLRTRKGREKLAAALRDIINETLAQYSIESRVRTLYFTHLVIV